MAVHRTKGFVLRREDVRETSILLTVYTKDYGKLKLLSKGVRTPEQRFISSYELFALDDIVFYERKKKGFFFLSQCELLDFFPKARESLERLSYASYFVELLDLVTVQGEAGPELFTLLGNCLSFLSERASPKRVARVFEIKLLSALGHMPRIRQCASCAVLLKEAKTKFSLTAGGLLCEKCVSGDRKAKPVLQGTINFMRHIEDLPFERLKHIKVSNKVGSEVERLLRGFITYHLDVKPRSAEFITKVGV